MEESEESAEELRLKQEMREQLNVGRLKLKLSRTTRGREPRRRSCKRSSGERDAGEQALQRSGSEEGGQRRGRS